MLIDSRIGNQTLITSYVKMIISSSTEYSYIISRLVADPWFGRSCTPTNTENTKTESTHKLYFMYDQKFMRTVPFQSTTATTPWLEPMKEVVQVKVCILRITIEKFESNHDMKCGDNRKLINKILRCILLTQGPKKI